MEIEKKFLIKQLPVNLYEYEKKEIEQGYLCFMPVIRIRKSNDQYILTYKMKKENTVSGSTTICNMEEEFMLTQEAYLHLKSKTDNNIIEKTRYIIPLSECLKAELDIFGGRLEGLIFAEVEFESVEASECFIPPKWFGKDVSDNKHYRNSFLSTVNSYDEFLSLEGKDKEKFLA